jgi:hypothetical protein
MWFSDMTQMPRLRECLYELASNKLMRLRNLFGARAGRRGAGHRDNRGAAAASGAGTVPGHNDDDGGGTCPR